MAREGIYGEISALRASINADENHLANAPLGPRQKKSLARSIAVQRARLTEVLAELRKSKKEEQLQKP